VLADCAGDGEIVFDDEDVCCTWVVPPHDIIIL
jgi:hypothetical protein